MGALAAAGTGFGQALNLAHLPGQRQQGATGWQRIVDGALMATVWAPLAWVGQARTLIPPTTPRLTHTAGDRPPSVQPLPSPEPKHSGLAIRQQAPKHGRAEASTAISSSSQRGLRPQAPWPIDPHQLSVLGISPFRSYHLPRPHDDTRALDAGVDRDRGASATLEPWARAPAGSPEHHGRDDDLGHSVGPATRFQALGPESDAADVLAKAPLRADIRRLHAPGGQTITIDLTNQRVVMSDAEGAVMAMEQATHPAQMSDAHAYWQHASHVNPPVAVRDPADYALAMTALDVQRKLWQADALPQETIARYLLEIRDAIDADMARLSHPKPSLPQTLATEAPADTLPARYHTLKRRGYTAQQMIDAALDTTGTYQPGHTGKQHRSALPQVRWTATSQFPSAEQHLVAQWLGHRYELAEFKTIHEFLAAAQALAHAQSSPSIERHTLAQGARLSIDYARQWVLLEVGGAPHTLFRPLDVQAFGQRMRNTGAAQSASDVSRYAETLSTLKAQVDRQQLAPVSITESLVDTLARASAKLIKRFAAGPAFRCEPSGSALSLAAGSARAHVAWRAATGDCAASQ